MERELPYSGIILDVDGVITDTRNYHFEAWKDILDDYLSRKNETKKFTRFDYEKYVDGRIRSEGIRNFFRAYNIEVLDEEVRRIGDQKNQAYQNFLKISPPKLFPEVIECLKSWKGKGIKIAVVSSSQSGRMIVDNLKIKNLIDICIDGIDGHEMNLRSKPEPDYFNEAVKQLGLQNSECALVEDSIIGIEAGKKMGLMTIYGMSRVGQTPAKQLYQSGADVVIKSLLEIGIMKNAISSWEDIKDHIGEREIALFIDFDGTLSNIVSSPIEAKILESSQVIIKDLSKAIKIAVVSGRDRIDVKGKVAIENIFYLGCHGLDMSGPGCFHYRVDDAEKYLPELEEATQALKDSTSEIKGILIEKKPFATAVHYRMSPEEAEGKVFEISQKILSTYPHLKIKKGKKVIEFMPKVDWDKGQAIKKLCEILDINSKSTMPVYIGDDETDEDAFHELHGKGIGIRVDGNANPDTYANYVLNDPSEVSRFLEILSETYTGNNKLWRHGA